MKKTFCGWFSILFFLSFTVVSFAQANREISTTSKYAVIESNYLNGLETGNSGIKVSCAYFLGDMKSEKAVIPIMKLFRETKNDGAKLVYAWSLFKIGDAKGVYLVKREIEVGNCDKIRCMLSHLYKDYCLKTNGKID